MFSVAQFPFRQALHSFIIAKILSTTWEPLFRTTVWNLVLLKNLHGL